MARVPTIQRPQQVYEEADQSEGLDDLMNIDPLLVQEVVVNSTDWDDGNVGVSDKQRKYRA